MVYDLERFYNLKLKTLVSKDRDSGDSASGGGLRFRNQSPSSQRRSRDRERREMRKDRDNDTNNMLVSSSDMTTDHTESLDDSRLIGNDESTYQSFINDEVEGPGDGTNDRHHQRSNSYQALDRLNTKIACTKESIRKEQTARDDNVNEYLKLAAIASADKQQLQRIKTVFEKKNQKSAHTISQLQKKLESYSKRVKDLQIQQNQRMQGHRQPREVLRDVGQGLKNVGGNIRDGITGLGGSVMSKPREFAHLIKNKFGSADNINQLSSTWYTDPELNSLNLSNQMDTSHGHHGHHHHHHHHGSSTPNNTGLANTAGSGSNQGGGSGKFSNENDSECSSVTSDSIPAGSGKSQPGINQYSAILKAILAELQERREDCDKLREKLERLEGVHKDFQDVTNALEGERYRAERLEEQINDLTELHQNEIENLKQAMADMEEKVQYQSDERLRDVNEVLENCQTRISKMEHMSQQQYVTVEGIDNSNARALVVKLINVVLTVLQVVLLLVATAAGIIMPFLKTRVRVLTTLFFILVAIFVIRQWPDVRDIGSHMMRHLKESLMVK
ncbi:transmembrane and coiled-coil domains protein 2-like isoform X3 [Bradysia coprophila]|uniref:transmembrane and coiled-coil domains protein 2-like isoform X3 n=1 Tax=Bradysia coprophila TaxID=38358 RepID=UPI00187D8A56|nr:transmembrane and coiled-coil domains protein 2-like isoform X3 [Bradysia coprophila]XP_037047472.1 transmembrane and coiled-coil domains protein 2-like isoform X3 [Bradysia coprophila]